MRVVTVNVNGIRAAARRGMVAWLQQAQPDVLTLQEVRADDVELGKVLADAGLAHWSVAHTEGTAKGRAGVAVVSREAHTAVRVGIDGQFADEGRWVETDLDTPAGPITVVSTYVHTGEAGTDRQVVKYAFLDAVTRRLHRARAADDASRTGRRTSRTGRATSRRAASCPRSAPTWTAGSTATRGSTYSGVTRATSPGRTRGGRGGARRSTTTPAGASTTSSRAGASRRP